MKCFMVLMLGSFLLSGFAFADSNFENSRGVVKGVGNAYWSVDDNTGPDRTLAESLAQKDAENQCSGPANRISDWVYQQSSRGWEGQIQASALFACVNNGK